MRAKKSLDKNICFKLLDILERTPKTRRELIDEYIKSLGLCKEEQLDHSTGGKMNLYRSAAGDAISEMQRKGIIRRTDDGLYYAQEQKPVVIRIERCEKLLLKFLAERPLSKNAIRLKMVEAFGTDKTLTDRDDNKLFTIMQDILRRLIRDKIVRYENKIYSLSAPIAAKIDDIGSMLTLKENFLSRIYNHGGEFFEYYFMTLIEKYFIQCGKTVLSNTVTGGSSDGGIDGIIVTKDSLGFRETTMVQTKNRSEAISETDVRGFYGAVCAKQGSRGIFATTSSFHYSATQFLNALDNCVGVGGEELFKMAIKTGYGIKKSSTGYIVDDKVI